MTNEYKTVAKWEDWATENLSPLFGLEVKEVCKDYKRNHDEGTDAILKNFDGKRYARVDFKWSRIFDYKNLFFALEDKTKKGDAWTDNFLAMEKGVIILVPWKKDNLYKLSAYRLTDLHDLAEVKRMGCPRKVAHESLTKYFPLWEPELKDLLVWESKWVDLTEKEKEWKKNV